MPISQKTYAAHAGFSRGRVSQLCRQGMPLTSPEAADDWRGLTARQRPEAFAAPPECLPRPSQPAPDLDGAAESIRAAWGRLERCERVAFEMLEAAHTEGRPDAGRLVAIHTAAVRLSLAGVEHYSMMPKKPLNHWGEYPFSFAPYAG